MSVRRRSSIFGGTSFGLSPTRERRQSYSFQTSSNKPDLDRHGSPTTSSADLHISTSVFSELSRHVDLPDVPDGELSVYNQLHERDRVAVASTLHKESSPRHSESVARHIRRQRIGAYSRSHPKITQRVKHDLIQEAAIGSGLSGVHDLYLHHTKKALSLAKLRGMLMHRKSRNIAVRFYMWKAHAAQCEQCKVRILYQQRKVILRSCRDRLSRSLQLRTATAFQHWFWVTSQERYASYCNNVLAARCFSCWKRLKMRRNRLNEAVETWRARLLFSNCSRIIVRWKRVTDRRKRAFGLFCAFLRRQRHTLLCSGFQKIKLAGNNNQLARKFLSRLINRRSRLCITAAFERWNNFTAIAKILLQEHRLRTNRHLLQIRCSMLHWSRVADLRTFSRAFHRWQCYTECEQRNAKTSRLLRRRADSWHRRHCIRNHLLSWAACTCKTRCREPVTTYVVVIPLRVKHELRCAEQRYYFGVWKTSWQVKKRLRVVSLRIARVCACRLMRRLFQLWAKLVIDKRRLSRWISCIESRRVRVRFVAWRYVVNISRQRQQQILAQAVRRMRQICTATAFSGWRHNLRKLKRRRCLLSTALRRMELQHATAALGAWQLFVTKQKRHRALIHGAVARMTNSRLSGAMRKWHGLVRNSRCTQISILHSELSAFQEFRKRQIRSVINKMRHMRLLGLFEAWRHYIVEKQHKRQSTNRAILRMKNLRLARCFSSWNDCLWEQKRLRTIATRIVGRMSRMCLAASFNGWRSKTNESRRLKCAASRVVRRWRSLRRARCFRTWAKHVNLQQQQKRAVRRWRSLRRARCFRTWAKQVNLQQQQKRAAQRVVSHMKARHIAKGFRRWHTAWARLFRAWWNSVEQSRRFKCIVHRMLKLNLARAFHAFRSNIQEQLRVRRVANRVVQRLKHRRMTKTFLRWKGHVLTQKRRVVSMQRMVCRWQRYSTASAFDSWAIFVDCERKRRRFMRKALVRFEHNNVVAAFQQWQQVLRLSKEEWFKAQQTNHEEWRQARICRFVSKIQYLGRSKAFEAWRTYHKNIRRSRIVAARAMRRFRRFRLAQCFSAWVDNVKDIICVRRIVGNTFRRMQSRHLSKSFNSWLFSANKSRRLRNLGKIVVNRMQRLYMAACFNAWVVLTEEKQRHRCIAVRAMRRMKGLQLARLITTWRMNVYDVKRMRYLQLKALHRMVRKQLLACFNTWTEVVKTTKHKRGVAKYAFRRMRNLRTAQCFTRWRENVGERQRLRCIAVRVVSRLKRKRLAQCFDSWCNHVGRKQRLRSSATRVMARWCSRRLSRCFDGWVNFVQNMYRRRELVQGAVRRMVNHKLSKAFYKFRLNMLEQRQLNAIRLVERKVSLLETQRRNLVQLIIRRMRMQNVERFFEKWRADISQKRKIGLVVRRWKYRSMQMIIHDWKAIAIAKRGHRVAIQRSLARQRRSNMRNIFIAWSNLINFTRRGRNFADLSVRHIRTGLAHRFFFLWRSSAMWSARRREKTLRWHGRRNERTVQLRAFAAWIEYVDGRRQKRILRLVRAFEGWAHSAQTMRAERIQREAQRNAELIQARKVCAANVARAEEERVAELERLAAEVLRETIEKKRAEKISERAERVSARAVFRIEQRLLWESFFGWRYATHMWSCSRLTRAQTLAKKFFERTMNHHEKSISALKLAVAESETKFRAESKRAADAEAAQQAAMHSELESLSREKHLTRELQRNMVNLEALEDKFFDMPRSIWEQLHSEWVEEMDRRGLKPKHYVGKRPKTSSPANKAVRGAAQPSSSPRLSCEMHGDSPLHVSRRLSHSRGGVSPSSTSSFRLTASPGSLVSASERTTPIPMNTIAASSQAGSPTAGGVLRGVKTAAQHNPLSH